MYVLGITGTTEWNIKALSQQPSQYYNKPQNSVFDQLAILQHALCSLFLVEKTTEGPVQTVEGCWNPLSEPVRPTPITARKRLWILAPAHSPFAISEVTHTAGRRNFTWNHHHCPGIRNAHALTVITPALHRRICLPATIAIAKESKQTRYMARKEIIVCCNGQLAATRKLWQSYLRTTMTVH